MYKIYIILLFTVFSSELINSEGVCGDGWDVFHDEYYDICYKYIADGLGDYKTVVTACKGELDATLPTINSQLEQDFLNKLIVKYKMIENVWLDASIKNKHIVWADSSSGEYENWLTGHPVNDINCVEMIPDSGNIGKWQDIACAKKNAYLCKRVMMWSDQRMQRLIRDNRRLLNEAVNEILQLKQSQVPIGFTYIQLPYQAHPTKLWPAYTWSDVTSSYAGQFFRAEGSGSVSFEGGVQLENAPRLSKVHRGVNQNAVDEAVVAPGSWSSWIWTGRNSGSGDFLEIQFYEEGGEVRPRNQAMRIFKRVK